MGSFSTNCRCSQSLGTDISDFASRVRSLNTCNRKHQISYLDASKGLLGFSFLFSRKTRAGAGKKSADEVTASQKGLSKEGAEFVGFTFSGKRQHLVLTASLNQALLPFLDEARRRIGFSQGMGDHLLFIVAIFYPLSNSVK